MLIDIISQILNNIFMDFDKLKKQATSQYQSPLLTKPKSSTKGQFETAFQPIFFTCLLYPLKRIQTNFQIKQSFVKQQIKNCKQFLTRCTHFGIRSLYRGLTPFFFKSMIPYSIYHSLDEPGKDITLASDYKFSKDQVAQFVKCMGLAIGYTLVYPLENVRVRMSADVQRQRVYQNMRDCLDKMRKSQGKSSFYRGYSISLIYIQLQYLLSTNIYKYLLERQNSEQLPSFFKYEAGFVLFLTSFLVSETVLHPIDSFRKLYQINGSMNHNNFCPRYRDVLKIYKVSNLYNGFQYRLLTGILYTVLLVTFEKNRSNYKPKN